MRFYGCDRGLQGILNILTVLLHHHRTNETINNQHARPCKCWTAFKVRADSIMVNVVIQSWSYRIIIWRKSTKLINFMIDNWPVLMTESLLLHNVIATNLSSSWIQEILCALEKAFLYLCALNCFCVKTCCCIDWKRDRERQRDT